MTLESKTCSLKGKQKVFALHLNQVNSCCRAYPEQLDPTKHINYYVDKWQDESQQLTDGVRLPGCEVCWKDEDRGLLSYRIQQKINSNNQIELWLSNLCNQMCSYCSPKYSSKWEEFISEKGMLKNISSTSKLNLTVPTVENNNDRWLDKIQDYINTCNDNSVDLILLGGEPLMQFRNLEKLLEFNINKIKILSINTNLNPPNNKFLLWLIDNVPNEKLKITISLDATPEYNFLPRHGFDSEMFLDNLELLKKHNINFTFSAVISVLSIFDIENFTLWISENQFNVNYFKINNPDCLDPKYIPLEFRLKIWDRVSHLNLPEIVKETLLHQDDFSVDLKLFEQYNYLSQYFTGTNTEPNSVQSVLFIRYWAWLTNFITQKYNL